LGSEDPLERFFASSDQFPLGIVELDAAAEYLGGVGLKPDGDWLVRQHDFVLQQGFTLVESERWARDLEGAERLGYSPQFSGELEEVRETRRNAIRGMSQQDKAWHLKSIHVNTHDYPQGDSNPCLSLERAMS
jgi:hypothetical protein